MHAKHSIRLYIHQRCVYQSFCLYYVSILIYIEILSKLWRKVLQFPGWMDTKSLYVDVSLQYLIRFQFAKWFLLLVNYELQMKFKNFFGRNTFRKRKRRNQNDFSRVVAVYSLHKRELKHKKNQPCFWIILFVHFSIINFPLFFEETQELDFLVCFRTWQWSDHLSNLKLHAATWANFGLKEGFIQMGNGAILRRWTLSALCPIFSFIAQNSTSFSFCLKRKMRGSSWDQYYQLYQYFLWKNISTDYKRLFQVAKKPFFAVT